MGLVTSIKSIVKHELEENMTIKDWSAFKMNGKASTNLYGHTLLVELKNKPKIKELKLSDWQCTVTHTNTSYSLSVGGFKYPQKAAKIGIMNMFKDLAKNKSLFTWTFVWSFLADLKKKENGNWTIRRIIMQILDRMIINHLYQAILFIAILFSTILLFIFGWYPADILAVDLINNLMTEKKQEETLFFGMFNAFESLWS